MADIHIKGLSELQKYLDTLPAKIEKNVVRGAMRAGMKVVLPVVQSMVPTKTGLLKAGLKLGTRSRGGRVTAYVKATGPHAYLARWMEYGTKAHRISGRKGGFLSFGGKVVKAVDHPGIKDPKKFMRPALDSQAGAAVVAAAQYMKARLASKHGIDTADVVIGGEDE